MRILVIEHESHKQKKIIQNLGTIPGIRITSLCADLTGAFDEVEHRPPDIVLVSSRFTGYAEFETMEMLFRMMSVKWLTIDWRDQSRGAMVASHSDKRSINLSAQPHEIAERLRQVQGVAAKEMPSPNVGLLRTPSGQNNGRLVLIGSSTGGVDALLRVLGSFPKDCPPTLIVQHTGSSFSSGLARLLDRNVAPDVAEAADGHPIGTGQIMLAPGSEKHLTIEGRTKPRCRLVASDRVNGHRPSVDMLFKSALPNAPQVTAVLLTGMGKDGGEGLLALRKAGALTIGQDRESCVVYGMPRYAAEIGAVGKVLPLSAIGPAVLRSTMAVAA